MGAHSWVDQAERKILHPQNLVVACGYSQFSFPCRCPMLFQNHQWGDSEGFRCVVGSTTTDSRSDQISLGDIVSRGMDDGPMPKDHPDIECFQCLIKGFGACSSYRRWWISGRGDAGRFSSRYYRSFTIATILSGNKTYYRR